MTREGWQDDLKNDLDDEPTPPRTGRMILTYKEVSILQGRPWHIVELRNPRMIEPTLRRLGKALPSIFRDDPVEIFVPVVKRDLDVFELSTEVYAFARSTSFSALFRLKSVTGVAGLVTAGDRAAKTMRSVLRRWKLSHRDDLSLEELMRWLQPVVRGWVNYYGRFYPSALPRALYTVDALLVRWAQRKYKSLKGHNTRAWDWLERLKSRQPNLLPHWCLEATVGR